MKTDKQRAWALDQLQKSLFFHRKLHEWGLLEVAERIEVVSGETLDWPLADLRISSTAWNKAVHNGIKPVTVFAHPDVLTTIEKSVAYYRWLAMVSQKSMNQLGMSTVRYEQSAVLPKLDTAMMISHRLNHVISNILESDQSVSGREFDLWRGMAAGSQAQGSWQNQKGDRIELLVRQDLVSRLKNSGLISQDHQVDIESRIVELSLVDGRSIRLAAEPDIMIYDDFRMHAAVEVKGGLDPAGVLERVGAAIKSLSRAKEESPGVITVLVLMAASMSDQAKQDLLSNKSNVNYWFYVEDILEDADLKQQYYSLLGLST